MLFNSFEFLIFLVVVLFLVWIIKNRNYQYIILLLASYYFYWFSSGMFFLLLIFSTLLDYYCGREIYNIDDKKIKKRLLLLSLVGNLGILGFFKYTNFAITTFNKLGFNFELLNVILPVGISFFTFQTMIYTLDIYFKKLKPTDSLLKFALYISFFPQLVAGPIVRAIDFIPQLKNRILFSYSNIKWGLSLVGWGLVKKMVFADNVSVIADSIFSNPLDKSSFLIILGAFAFGIQIYCDFSGYSDIAIGVARMMGFSLPLNFNKPYFAKNPSDFWKRWHISLSSWLRDYLYIPLGGNRRGNVVYTNLMITMVLGGLWHGAAYNFVLWGFYQGILLVVYKLISDKIRINSLISFIITQYFVFMGWILFRVKDMSHIIYSIKKYVLIDFSLIGVLDFFIINKTPIFLLLLFCYLHFNSFILKNTIDRIRFLKLRYWFLYVLIIVVMLLLFTPSETAEFIYFQF